MATIDQNGNSFSTDMNIGTNDNYAVNIKTNNTNKVGIDTSGRVGVGVATPTPFYGSAYLFPSLTPKMEVLTGTSFSTAYNEAVVIRHNGVDQNAVSRNVGLVLKLSTEQTAVESAKSCAIMLGSSDIYGNYPDMSFYTGNNANPRMQIQYSGSIKMSSLAGTGTRMVTADSTGTLSASNTLFDSGIYTPSATMTPTGTPTAHGFTYIRVGNIVTVTGLLGYTGATAGSCMIEISIPIPSTFASNEDLLGVVTGNALNAASPNYVVGDAANTVAQVNFSSNAGAGSVYVQFQYQVI